MQDVWVFHWKDPMRKKWQTTLGIPFLGNPKEQRPGGLYRSMRSCELNNSDQKWKNLWPKIIISNKFKVLFYHCSFPGTLDSEYTLGAEDKNMIFQSIKSEIKVPEDMNWSCAFLLTASGIPRFSVAFSLCPSHHLLWCPSVSMSTFPFWIRTSMVVILSPL